MTQKPIKQGAIISAAAVAAAAIALTVFCQSHAPMPPWLKGLGPVQLVRDINYTEGLAEPAHRLDLVAPAGHRGALPLIVYIHGGAWIGGDKWDCPGAILVKAGYAVASVNYRLADQAKFPAQINDLKAAIRYLRAHARQYNIDAQKIGVWGHSAGGHLAALLGTTCGVTELEGKEGNPHLSSCVQAVCDWSGPSNLVSIAGQC